MNKKITRDIAKELLDPTFSKEEQEIFIKFVESFGANFSLPDNPISGDLSERFKKAVSERNDSLAAIIGMEYFLSSFPEEKLDNMNNILSLLEEQIEKGQPFKIKTPEGETAYNFNDDSFDECLVITVEKKKIANLIGEEILKTEPLSIVPNTGTTYLLTSKLNRVQTDPNLGDGSSMKFSVGGKGKNEAFKILSILTPDKQPITPYERELQETIGALMQKSIEKNPVFSPEQIYGELTGIGSDAYIRKEKREKLIQTIDRLRFTEVTIDCSDPINKHRSINLDKENADKLNIDFNDYKEKKDVTAIIRANAISAKRATITYNGNTVDGYKFFELPPVFLCSSTFNQIAKVDSKLLNSNNANDETTTRKNTDDFIVLKRVLLKMVEHMKTDAAKNGGKYESRRTYKKIFSETLGTESPSKKKAETIKKDIDIYLDLLKKHDYIKGYSKYKNGRAYAGVEIII